MEFLAFSYGLVRYCKGYSFEKERSDSNRNLSRHIGVHPQILLQLASPIYSQLIHSYNKVLHITTFYRQQGMCRRRCNVGPWRTLAMAVVVGREGENVRTVWHLAHLPGWSASKPPRSPIWFLQSIKSSIKSWWTRGNRFSRRKGYWRILIIDFDADKNQL